MRVSLHSGRSAVFKGIMAALVIILALTFVPLAGLVFGVISGWASPVLAWVVRIVTWLGLWALCLWFVLWLLRTAVWLEGTVLVRRGALRTRRCDLAAAPRVVLDATPETQTINGVTSRTGRHLPRLTAWDAQTGRPVRLLLVDPALHRWLDPPKLRALADAILAGPRPEPLAAQAWQVAQGLRAMSADPTGRIR